MFANAQVTKRKLPGFAGASDTLRSSQSLKQEAIFPSKIEQYFANAFSCSDAGVVSAKNVAVARSIIRINQRIRFIQPLLQTDRDADGDGVMMLTEMLTSAKTKLDTDAARANGMQNIPKEIMQMDVDGGGKVMIDEIRAVVEAVSS